MKINLSWIYKNWKILIPTILISCMFSSMVGTRLKIKMLEKKVEILETGMSLLLDDLEHRAFLVEISSAKALRITLKEYREQAMLGYVYSVPDFPEKEGISEEDISIINKNRTSSK